MITYEAERVIVLDLDGVVNWRIPFQKAGVPLIGKPNPDGYLKPVAVKPLNREQLDPFTPKQIYDGVRHLLAPVFPDVIRVINTLDGSSTIYGNTGRHNSKLMKAATVTSLTWFGIYSKFGDIYFRQHGFTTLEAKTAALADITQTWNEDQMEIVDDNPHDLLPISRMFRNARFHLIRDWTTDRLLKGVDMREFPNVDIKPTLRAALLGCYDNLNA